MPAGRTAPPPLALAPVLALTLAACGWGAAGCSDDRGRTPGPNVVVYVVDTLRADALPFYARAGGRGEHARAPNLERFARDGVTFERVYSPSSWTRPSVATILTGVPPRVHGVVSRRDALRADVPMLSERLRDAGWATGAFVGNPNAARRYGFDRGWDVFYEGFTRGPMPSVEELTATALHWLETAPRPFLLFILAVDPHHPYLPPEDFDRYEPEPDVAGEYAEDRAKYLGEVEYADHGFGMLLEALREEDELDETIVAFTSDHGEEFGDHGRLGHGKTVFEEVLRVPLVLRYPPSFAAGERRSATAAHVDLVPTLLELTRTQGAQDLPGHSLLRFPARPERTLFSRIDIDVSRASALTRGAWKLVLDEKAEALSLFDLANDPGESRDLSTARGQRARVQDMREELTKLAQAQIERRRQTPRIDDRELAAETRRALEVLGYLAPEDEEPEPSP